MVEDLLKAGELPCLVATSSLELGIDMGAIDLVLQVESPKSVTAGLQRIGRAGHNVGDVSQGPHLPQVPRRPARVRGRRPAHARGQHRDDGRAAQPARRARPADRRHGRRPREDGLRVDDLYALVTRTYSYAELSRDQLENVLDMLDGRYPSEEFGELRARIVWDRVAGTIRPRARRPRAGHHQRRHDPRPRPLLRQPARRPPRRRARRGDGLRGAARADLPARRLELADRGDHARPRDRQPGARRPGRGAVLEGRRPRPPEGARPGDRRLRPLGRRPGARRAARRVPPRRAGGRQPGRLPARAAGGHTGDPERPHGRHRALPRRDRRLAAVHPLPLRRPRARHLGPGAERPHPRAVRPRVGRHLVRRRHHRPPARRRRAARAPSS